MSSYAILLFLNIIFGAYGLPQPLAQNNADIQIITRKEWNARPPRDVSTLMTPVPVVIIHHSYVPGACYNLEECSKAMRNIQDSHQIHQKWSDIGYNFAVGSDGLVYEGRGWETVGAHAAGRNSISIGIVLIGDWVSNVPPANQMEAVKKLILVGIEQGYISENYSLIGHRQVTNTECPGQALFNEISTWENFESNFRL